MNAPQAKTRYEPPTAVFVAVQVDERLTGCGQTSTFMCGDAAAYS